jgi:hypothetical protein
VPQLSGKFRVTLQCDQTGRTMESELLVRGIVREETGKPAQTEVLREIAGITRGVCGASEDLAAFVNQLATLPEAAPVERRLRLWCHPAWGATLLGLLTIYWIGRKIAGLI